MLVPRRIQSHYALQLFHGKDHEVSVTSLRWVCYPWPRELLHLSSLPIIPAPALVWKFNI